MTVHSPSVVLTIVTSMMAASTKGQLFMTSGPPMPPTSVCATFPPFVANSTSGLQPMMNLMTWHSVLLIIGVGLFGVVVAHIFKFIRRRLYDDGSAISDTFFNAGGNVNFALVASSVVARWLWTSSFTWSTLEVYNFGLVGHFWYSAATAVPVLLFATAAFKLRVNAPGAKTFLQVIKTRFGRIPHIVIIAIALIVNLFIGGVIQMEAIRIITSVTQNISHLAVGALISVMTGIFSSQGGIGGGVYFNYFAVVFAVSIALTFFIDTLYNPFQRPGSPFMTPVASSMYRASSCAMLPPMSNNAAGSALTFASSGALTDAVTILLSGLGCVFVDQSFWQAATMAVPSDAVYGILSGGLTVFVIPFVFSFVFGMSFWTISIQQGSPAVDMATANSGLLSVIVSQRLMSSVGDFLIVSLTLAVTISALSSQILAVVSIMTHDIYLTYIEKTIPATSTTTVSKPSHSCLNPTHVQVTTNESKDFARFKRSNIFLKTIFIAFTSLAIYTSATVMLGINVRLWFIFKLVGIISCSAVIPVLLSVAWYRTTAAGFLSGIFVGFAAGFVGWLAYSGALPGSLYSNVGHPLPFLVGLALSLGLGGLTCLVVSLLCGGCQNSVSEQAMWEKTAKIDNPLSPWVINYANNTDISLINKQTGLPDFKEFRKTFRYVEFIAYIGSVLLSLILMVFWPALMLIAGTFTESTFNNWTILVLVFGIIATGYIGVTSPVLELIQQCRQLLNKRKSKHVRLEDENSSTTAGGQRTLQTVDLPQPPEHHQRFANLQQQSLSPVPVLTDASKPSAANNYVVYPPANTAAESTQVWKTSVHLD